LSMNSSKQEKSNLSYFQIFTTNGEGEKLKDFPKKELYFIS